MRRTIHRDLVIATVAAMAFVEALVLQAGVGRFGEVVGLSCAVGVFALVTTGLAASRRAAPGPADRVTLARAVLSCGVAAMVADAVTNDSSVERSTTLLVVLAAVALLLDALDGPIARRTGTASPFGARFDMECDAFLILVLAVHVSRALGWWVLLIGSARYLLLLATRAMPWLDGEVHPRWWRKAVAAYAGVGLTAAASRSLPHGAAVLVVGGGLTAIVVSFGTQAAELRRSRRLSTVPDIPGRAPVTFAAPSTAPAAERTTAEAATDVTPAQESAVPRISGVGRSR